jgi:hypothetical protein
VFGHNKDARAANQKFASTDFNDRNLSFKKKHLKAVVTEESLDDWYAHSLGIEYDKYIKQKKMLQQIMIDAKRKKNSVVKKEEVKKKSSSMKVKTI